MAYRIMAIAGTSISVVIVGWCGVMIAQVKEELRLDGRLMENIQTVFKVVHIDRRGRFCPAMTIKIGANPLYDPSKIIPYISGTHYKVGDNFDYPAFAFHDEIMARDFIWMVTEGASNSLAILSCVAFQWAWLEHYMSLTQILEPESLALFWSTTLPFRADGVPFAAHSTPSGTIGLFEFEIGNVIYGG